MGSLKTLGKRVPAEKFCGDPLALRSKWSCLAGRPWPHWLEPYMLLTYATVTRVVHRLPATAAFTLSYRCRTTATGVASGSTVTIVLNPRRCYTFASGV
jgi:hypothetical protein